MSEYLAPAVYVTEIPFVAHPIEGVSTTTAEHLSAAVTDRSSAAMSNGMTPDWTDHNQHDPGITVLELSAWVTESLAYRSDRSELHAVAAARLQASVPSSARAQLQIDQHVPGTTGGASSEVQPNREFPDLWLRFVSSVAQFEHQSGAAQRAAGAPGQEIGRVDLSQVVSKYIGETEKNLEAVFGRAEQSSAALLFDEAEALLGKRTDVRDSHDRYANLEVNPLLQEIEGHEATAILTTNSGDKIDPDVLKRLRAEVALPFPPRPRGDAG